MKAIYISTTLLICLSFASAAYSEESTKDVSHAAAPADGVKSDSRAVEENTKFSTDESVPGKCEGSFVHVRTSKNHPEQVRIFADLPAKEKEKGSLYFCGSTIEGCTNYANGYQWEKGDTNDTSKMVLTSFSPAVNQSVTILRVPPKVGDVEPKACFQEIKIESLKSVNEDGKERIKGEFTLKSAIAGFANKDAKTVLGEVQEGFKQAAERQRLQAAQQPQIQSPQFGGQRQPAGWPNGQVYQQPQYGFQQQQQVYSDYQSIAQARANAMARYNYFNHYGVPGAPEIPNVSEGIGMRCAYNQTPSIPQTCFFTGPVIADAIGYTQNGAMICAYRVRFFNGGQYTGASY